MPIDFENLSREFAERFNGTSDLVTREINTEICRAKLFFFDGMTDSVQVDQSILRPIAERGKNLDFESLKYLLYSGCSMKESDLDEAVTSVSAGDAALIAEGNEKIIVFSVRKGNVRSITEPPTSLVIKGPREGFVEDLKTNMVLLRRRIRSDKLVFETLKIGTITQTAVVLAYIKGIVKQDILAKVKAKIKSVETDGIVDSSAISKILETRPYSLFKQLGSTEKPDVVSSKMLDGRVAILVDGSPIALTVPFLAIEDFQVSQDSYNRNARVTFLRLMRVLAVFFAVILPGAYVALQVYQYQFIPLQLLITLLNATNGIPFTPTLEMLIALVFFEILNDASVRMPRHVGMALSVVGAIVLGDTAVQAGVLSSVTVLVVAISGLGLYTVPDEVGVLSIIRMILVVVGGLFGIYGVLLVCAVFIAYLSDLNNYDVPYLAPFAPIEDEALRQSLMGFNFTDKKFRTQALRLFNKVKTEIKE